ncbi:YggS family pyridoxal phosphate-dependent enzyme [Thermoflexus sp.]|uniref:YggS family pyridoxal phosphate-dependent enzyme n=1 Tax=Thermoflexus sp. TaxID=1969742 RepID=UPI0025E55CF6|nr:YggS family pyridoxal phosphate-dependent enzyme [Thermoflexus sp.]MDW8064528.1 YggS family pyridoxal phosphate-dependent enzyme [Anaerolineae bacterium]MCS6963486.1 YggS family pyridoxal phosphate-dependent enzyme [Thermoflexus sp.]MCS7351655.1 YggS family pyridoxal phosphate-dependent enzyme [Thermoflexus sp.]MCX7690897.1 YggS family pyridoxal phosphate-dependent enzyme [Thermoflexus sp.]MDW8181113.1 YggS family pyridoxal phosphate-dependent enzyme [Anaerolineae bacterium]
MSPSIAERWEQVQERIARAARRAGRDPATIQVVAVTKTVPPERIVEAYACGLRIFGENRVEEAEEKIPQVQALLGSEAAIQWHMVGHLQRRKARRALRLFEVIHSVDSVPLAEKLSRLAAEEGRPVKILLECNVSGEASKYGFLLDRWEEDAAQREAFFQAVACILEQPGLQVLGLMTMAPIAPDPEAVRPVFRRLRALRDALASRFPQAPWAHLSMGMTDDFEVAIEEGATMVRLGRAIFGERPS